MSEIHVYVLLRNGKPIRVYFDEERAQEDFLLVSEVRTSDDYHELAKEIPVLGDAP